ncbi:uncharacterized protein LOC135702663 [Ochlerotatus camptorhynchus]|uniref:uncharacterized protein LOC135702663 n=1 Tax=Ochlerotatus camptorhynchus TaxID=644619 RepID=UPI0031CE7CF0
MDKFLRIFIKFHGYCIAIVSSILTILFTGILSSNAESHIQWEDFVDLRFTGIPVLIFGITWMVANSLLIIGIFKETKVFLYPFCILFVIELFLMLIRDLFLVITLDQWYRTAFFNITLPFFLFVIPYVTMSMFALMRLFDIDPINRAEDNFVRFDRSAAEDVDRVTIRR